MKATDNQAITKSRNRRKAIKRFIGNTKSGLNKQSLDRKGRRPGNLKSEKI